MRSDRIGIRYLETYGSTLTHTLTHSHTHTHSMYLSPLSRECSSECAKERGRRYNNKSKRSEREGTRGRRRRRLSRSLVSHSRKARDIAATMSKFKLTPTRMIGPYVLTRSLTHSHSSTALAHLTLTLSHSNWAIRSVEASTARCTRPSTSRPATLWFV